MVRSRPEIRGGTVVSEDSKRGVTSRERFGDEQAVGAKGRYVDGMRLLWKQR